MLHVSGLVPTRFLTITSHLILTITVLISRDDNILACLPLDYSQTDFYRKDTELAAGLGVAIGLMAIELVSVLPTHSFSYSHRDNSPPTLQVGFLSGITMFSPVQSLLSIGAHSAATVAMGYFCLDTWDCDLYWWIFGLCSCLPAVVELSIMVGVLGLKKPV